MVKVAEIPDFWINLHFWRTKNVIFGSKTITSIDQYIHCYFNMWLSW